jgi:hypothetical protein
VESPQNGKEKSRTEVQDYARGELTKSESLGLKTASSVVKVLPKCYGKIRRGVNSENSKEKYSIKHCAVNLR